MINQSCNDIKTVEILLNLRKTQTD